MPTPGAPVDGAIGARHGLPFPGGTAGCAAVRPWRLCEEATAQRPSAVSRRSAEEGGAHVAALGRRGPGNARGCATRRSACRCVHDWFSGYAIDPAAYLRRTFEEVAGYDELIVLRNIEFESHCEHHMAPIIGRAHVGYLPTNKIVGISKLARVVDSYGRRFQVQEKLTAEIARCISDVLKPRGVGVVIEAVHQCMTTRGVHKARVSMVHEQDARRISRRRTHARGIPAVHRDRRHVLTARRPFAAPPGCGASRAPRARPVDRSHDLRQRNQSRQVPLTGI